MTAKASARPRAEVHVQYASRDACLPSRSQVRRWVRAASLHDAEVTVRFVGEAEGRTLNAQFRGNNRPTNVLSFSYAQVPRIAGDLVLCVPVVQHEAIGQGKTVEAHFAHLIVHGMLHLQGFDHDNESDAFIMEAKECMILAGLGFADPYASER